MRLLILLFVLAGVVLLALLLTRAATTMASRDGPPATEPGRWRPAHVSRDGVTHVVVRREGANTGRVLDERQVVTVPDDDPDYDAKFLEALAAAESRAALFNSEEA